MSTAQRELLRRVGNLAQVGGVGLLQPRGGPRARDARASSSARAAGLRFTVGPDRGFDVGFAEFQGIGLCWLPPKGLAGPWYYEGDLDDYAWLRVGLGGLFNTAGLVSMGTTADFQHYVKPILTAKCMACHNSRARGR